MECERLGVVRLDIRNRCVLGIGTQEALSAPLRLTLILELPFIMAQTLEQWIIEALNDDDKEGELSMLSCVHVIGQSEREVHTVKFGGKKWTAHDLGDLFLRKAKNTSQELSGAQHFALLAFYGGRSQFEARKPFRIQGDTDLAGQNGSEGPTGTGLTQQAMRHMEAVMALAVRQTSILFEAQNSTITSLSTQLDRTRNENIQAFDAVKNLLMEKATNSHQHRMEQLSFKRSSDDRAALWKLAPAALNRLSGKTIVPESTADTALIESLATAISENPEAGEALMQAAQAFPPQLMGMLASRLEQIMKAKREERERDDSILNSNGMDPEADAAGEAH